jgi:hypothetical protein
MLVIIRQQDNKKIGDVFIRLIRHSLLFKEANIMNKKENEKMTIYTLLKGPISGHNFVLGLFFTTAAGVIVGFLIGQVI